MSENNEMQEFPLGKKNFMLIGLGVVIAILAGYGIVMWGIIKK